jgi:glycosyltransferase involved in cell wall biosynthesis
LDNLTVIIPFYNGHQHISALLSDLSKYDLPVILVDDMSDVAFDPKSVKGKPKRFMLMRLDTKGYFTGACNAGIKACSTDVLILNQDARLDGTKWLDLIDTNRSKYAMIGERISGKHPAWPNGYIHGTFMFMRRDALDKIGLMNAALFPLWGSTCDWQVRACRSGFSVLPVKSIPGFKHNRHGQLGSSIKSLLNKQPALKDLMIRTPPLVSVIVPCYNYGRYLPDLVNSMIGGSTSLGDMPGQTFQAFEIVIVDDESDDETPGIIASLVDPWKGIRSVRRAKRGGTPAANNTGVMASYGRAITILCADDMMEPTRLEKMYKLWQEDQRRVVCDDNYMFADGKRVQIFHMREYDFDDLLNKNSMHCGIMFSRKAFDEVGGYPVEMTHGREDWAMNVRLGVAGYCGYHLREPLYLYRREGQNRTLRNTTKQWRAAFRAQMEALFPEIYKGKRPVMCCGKKTTVKVPAQKAGPRLSSIIGGNGMTMLRYIGKSQGTQTFYGFATGQAYKFGLSRPLGYVDNRDLLGSSTKPGLLDMSESGKKLFAIEPMNKTKVAALVPAAMAAAVDNFKPDTTPQEIVSLEEEAPEAIYPEFYPEEMTVAEIRNLTNLTKEQANDLYEKERSGKNRSTVLKIFSAYL